MKKNDDATIAELDQLLQDQACDYAAILGDVIRLIESGYTQDAITTLVELKNILEDENAPTLTLITGGKDNV